MKTTSVTPKTRRGSLKNFFLQECLTSAWTLSLLGELVMACSMTVTRSSVRLLLACRNSGTDKSWITTSPFFWISAKEWLPFGLCWTKNHESQRPVLNKQRTLLYSPKRHHWTGKTNISFCVVLQRENLCCFDAPGEMLWRRMASTTLSKAQASFNTSAPPAETQCHVHVKLGKASKVSKTDWKNHSPQHL